MIGSAPAVILMAGRSSASGEIKKREHIPVLHISALEFLCEDDVLRTYKRKASHWKISREYDVLTEFFLQSISEVRISRSQFSYLNGTESFTEGEHVEPIEHEVGLEQLPGPETMLEITSMRSLSLVVFCT